MTTRQRDTDDDVGSERAEEFAREHPGLVKLGRVGWAAKGLVYSLVGLLALRIAIGTTSGGSSGGGSSDGEASPGGAISEIADTSWGTALMYVIAAGLVLFAIWRIVSAALPASSDASSWMNRVGYLVSAATYLLLAFTAWSFARSPGNSKESEDSKIESFTADVMSESYGRWLVFVVGAVLIGVACAFAWKAISGSFISQLGRGGVGPFSHDAIVWMGRVGWAGRTAMMGLIGFFICRAAWTFDPDDAQGLDGSLRKVAESGLGTALVLVVAVGLFTYGAFCIVSAPRRLLVAADE